MNPDKARAWTRDLYRRFLPEAPDGHRAYLELLDRLCPQGGRVVDLGCGDENFLSFLLTRAEVVGVDRRKANGLYHRYLQADLESGLPLEKESVDLAACKFLLEHLERPEDLVKAVRNALRPGGHLVVMTPNILYYPYAFNFLLSRLLSQRVRMGLVRLLTGREEDEVFPVRYRSNTPFRLRRLLEENGYQVIHLRTYPDYQVSALCRVTGAVAVLYEVVTEKLGVPWAGGFLVAAARRV